MRAPPSRRPPKSSSGAWRAVNVVAKLNVAVYRLSGGRLANTLGRAPILVLHHVGAKSGTRREAPVLSLEDGEKLVIVASKGGTDRNPAWFHNLKANPETEVEIGRERRAVRARQATDEEREAYWPRLVEMYPQYADYAGYTPRQIPVIVLDPR